VEGIAAMEMKLVVAIVQNDDADELIENLTAADYRATRLASTGGFLRQGNTTIIVGVPAQEVNNVVNIIAMQEQNPKQIVSNPFPTPTTVNLNTRQGSIVDMVNDSLSGKIDKPASRATVFVLNLDRYERI